MGRTTRFQQEKRRIWGTCRIRIEDSFTCIEPEMAFLLIYPSNRNQASKLQIKQIRVFFMPFYASIVDKSPFSGKMIVL